MSSRVKIAYESARNRRTPSPSLLSVSLSARPVTKSFSNRLTISSSRLVPFTIKSEIMASGDGPIDLAQLQKTYKMVENDRARYAEESQNIIKRQRQAIEKIRKENERLKEQLESETRSRGESNSTQVHMAR